MRKHDDLIVNGHFPIFFAARAFLGPVNELLNARLVEKCGANVAAFALCKKVLVNLLGKCSKTSLNLPKWQYFHKANSFLNS